MSTSPPITPGTPEQFTPRRVAMTRSFTVPPKLTVSTRTNPTPEIGAADGIETLYVHPSASIIKFTTGGSRPGSSSGSPRAKHADGTGTLPWAYPTESTVAVGPMEIYRVPGSVSFLHSGALLHAILPRSQCWCVDGVSKFAFRVLPETYYRIELPGETSEDLELVEALKVTLQKVLFYERTPCPFARGFTVDLPVEEIKVKKRNSVRGGPAKKWRLQKTYSWKPEGWEEEEVKGKNNSNGSQSSEDKGSEPSDEDDVGSDQSTEERQEDPNEVRTTPSKLRPMDMQAHRSVTAPTQLQTRQTLPSRVRSRVQAVETVDRAQKAERVRFSAEVDRRSSVRAKRLSTIPVDMPPSPPDSSAGAEIHVEERESDFVGDLDNVPDELDKENASYEIGIIDENNADESQPNLELENRANADFVDDRHASSESTELEVDTTTQHMDLATSKDESQGDAERSTSRHDTTEEEVEVSQTDEEPITQQSTESSSTVSSQPEVAKDVDSQLTSVTSASKAPLPTRAEDPYAAIQARIQARRSIGGTTTSFQPTSNPPTRKSSSSNVSSVSVAAQRPSKSNRAQRQQSVTAALVNKACAVFLGPPAHLVTMMLRIAARISSGAFGSNSMFFVESPIGSPRRIPGSFYLEDEEDRGWNSEEEEEDWEEDDFGVPLKSPVRLSGLRERARRHGWEME